MTDNKLTDNEIIKALKECIELRFDDTEYATVRLDTLTNALDLITRQQVENENLKIENQSLRSAANSLKMHYEEAQAEIERLKALGVIVPPCKVGDKIYWVIDNITDRNIKEFCVDYDEETDFGVCEFTVYGFMKREDNSLRICIEEIDYYTVFFLYEKDIGKTVFLTREEAEKVLERSKGNA